VRAMAVWARSELGSKAMNSPIRAPVSAYRLNEVAGSENWDVFRRRVDIVGIPYVCNERMSSICVKHLGV
jgi:hypothetical protein